MQTTPLATTSPQRTSRWPIVALSLVGLAAAGISRFQGAPRTLPLEEALRTLVSCNGSNERELAMAAVAGRMREMVALLAIVERQGGENGRFAAAHLDNLLLFAQEERSR